MLWGKKKIHFPSEILLNWSVEQISPRCMDVDRIWIMPKAPIWRQTQLSLIRDMGTPWLTLLYAISKMEPNNDEYFFFHFQKFGQIITQSILNGYKQQFLTYGYVLWRTILIHEDTSRMCCNLHKKLNHLKTPRGTSKHVCTISRISRHFWKKEKRIYVTKNFSCNLCERWQRGGEN